MTAFRRYLCESPADTGHTFPEWQGFAYTAWAYSFQPDRRVDEVWVRCEETDASGWWIPSWTLTESDTLEFRRLARFAKCFRAAIEEYAT